MEAAFLYETPLSLPVPAQCRDAAAEPASISTILLSELRRALSYVRSGPYTVWPPLWSSGQSY
jgi:hypothetical protein